MDNKIDNLKHILHFYTHKYSSIIRPVLSLIKFSLHSIILFPRSGINCTSILGINLSIRHRSNNYSKLKNLQENNNK